MTAHELEPDDRLPRIRDLHRRHAGLTAALSAGYEEATAVCLADKCSPPTEFSIWRDEHVAVKRLIWRAPSDRQLRAWANETDRIAAAAYGVSLSAVEVELGLVAITRARNLSGADNYVGAPGGDDYLESAIRLEVSGTASPEARRLNSRVKSKIAQVRRGTDASLACVVSFGALRIVIRRA